MKKTKKKFFTLKKLIILGSVILVIFAAINVAWFLTMYLPYHRCESKMEIIDHRGTPELGKYEGGYRYGVSMPFYLSWDDGYMFLDPEDGYHEVIDENGNVVSSSGLCIALFIWIRPLQKEKVTYGLDFMDENEWHQLYINSDLEYVPSDPDNTAENEAAEALIAENYDEIESLMNHAKAMWPDAFEY